MILQRYILRELALTFCLCFTALLFISMLGMTFQSLELISHAGLEVLQSTLPLAIAYIAPWAMLPAICISTTLVYGRMSADNEISAILTAGAHPWRILFPGVLFALVLCGASYLIHEYASPWAHYQKRIEIRRSVMAILKSPPGGNRTFKFGKYAVSYTHAEDGVMRQLLVIDRSDPHQRIEYTARSGRLITDEDGVPVLVLEEGAGWEESAERRGMIDWSDNVRVRLDLADWDKRNKRTKDKTAGELLQVIDHPDTPRGRLQALTEYHRRFAMTAAPLFLMLLAMPLGMMVRKGSRLAGLGAGLPPLFLFLVLALMGQGMGNRGQLIPAVAVWICNAATLLVASPFLWRVIRR